MVKFQGGTSPVHQPVLVIRVAGRNELIKRPKVGTDQNRPSAMTMTVSTEPDQPFRYLLLAFSSSVARAICTAIAGAGASPCCVDSGISVLIASSPVLAFCEC